MVDYNFERIYPEILYKHRIAHRDQTFPYHRHNGYEIYYFIQGNINFYLEHSCYTLKPGDLIIIEPTEMHRIIHLDNSIYERIVINIKQPMLDKLSTPKTNLSQCFKGQSKMNNRFINLNSESQKHFIYLTNKLGHSLNSENYGSDVLTNVYLSQILVMLNQLFSKLTFSGNNIMPILVKDVMLHIKQNIDTKITLEQLSTLYHYNGTYISRIFKQHTGLSIREYILDRRIDNAKTLLAKGVNITEVCNKLGFSNYSNFLRSFKKIVGIPPGKYSKFQQSYISNFRKKQC